MPIALPPRYAENRRLMPRRVLIIHNPAAGGATPAARRLGQFVGALENRGCRVVLRSTGTAQGDAEGLARAVEAEFDVIVAAGGDGTAHAVANGLAGTPRPMAILP